jgi:hypothetical protein
MTRTKRILFGLICGLLLLFAAQEIFRRCIGGFAGSYPFVEYWDLNVTEAELIEIIKELKTEVPSLQPPTQIALTWGRDSGYTKESMWVEIYGDELKKDSTAKPPKHDQSNSYGNAENGWTDYWYYIDFYYPDTKEIVHTWTRPDWNKSVTTLALISFSPLNDTTSFKFINRDFWFLANRRQISKFENVILDRIQQKINERRKSGL